MKVLDLCAGKGGASRAFKDRGHDVRTLDYDSRFGCTYTMDIREFAKDPRAVLGDWTPDFIIDGTPCDTFSVASMGHHWGGGKGPAWFHDHVQGKAKVIRFLKGRPKFYLDRKPTGKAGKFPSMVVVWDNRPFANEVKENP